MEGARHHEEQGMSLTLLQRLKSFDKMLVFIMVYLSLTAFNFGYDVATFNGVQAMQSFAKDFGELDKEQNRYTLPGWLSSVMTATPFLGKALGCASCGMIAERWGRKMAILVLCIVSFIGVILQTTATTPSQFTIGRVITFIMTGMVIVVIPIFTSETSPRRLRGMMTSTIQIMITFGSLVASLVTFGVHHPHEDGPPADDERRRWRLPIGLQLVMPAIILVLLPLLPESPRWLLSRHRREDAMRSLRKLRKAVPEKDVEIELQAIEHAHASEGKGSWAEVFDKSNRARTGVAVLAMFGQQITGQAFPSQYGVVFYISQGFQSQAFLFAVINSVLSLGAVAITWLFVDEVGRRLTLMVGGSLMGAMLFVLGAMGSVGPTNLTNVEKDVMVSSLMLFNFFYNLSWAPVSYVIVSEAAALRVKEKTNLLACVISVLATFVTSFTVPYLINGKYAGLGAKVGYIYASFNVVMVVLTYLFIPELKGRTLEEVDQLFGSRVPLRNFSSVRTKTAVEMYCEEITPGGEDTGTGGVCEVGSDEEVA